MNPLAVAYFLIGILLFAVVFPISKKFNLFKNEGAISWVLMSAFWPLMIYVLTAMACMNLYKRWCFYSSKRTYEKNNK